MYNHKKGKTKLGVLKTSGVFETRLNRSDFHKAIGEIGKSSRRLVGPVKDSGGEDNNIRFKKVKAGKYLHR